MGGDRTTVSLASPTDHMQFMRFQMDREIERECYKRQRQAELDQQHREREADREETKRQQQQQLQESIKALTTAAQACQTQVAAGERMPAHSVRSIQTTDARSGGAKGAVTPAFETTSARRISADSRSHRLIAGLQSCKRDVADLCRYHYILVGETIALTMAICQVQILSIAHFTFHVEDLSFTGKVAVSPNLTDDALLWQSSHSS